MKDRAAASVFLVLAAFALGAMVDRLHLGAWRSAFVPGTLALLYATVGVSVLRDVRAARWMGVGVAAMGLIWFSEPPFGWLEVGFDPLVGNPLARTAVSLAHLAPMLLLTRPDATPWQMSFTWMAAGAGLLPAMWLGLDALFFSLTAAVPLRACGATGSAWFAVGGAVAFLFSARSLAKERTRGLFGVLLAAGLLYAAHPGNGDETDIFLLSGPSFFHRVALGFAAVSLPFVPAIAHRLFVSRE